MKAIKLVVIALALLAVGGVIYMNLNDVTPLNMVDRNAYYSSNEGIALDGFDAISYFESKPVKGSRDFQLQWKGSSWLFSTQEHLSLFTENPERYAPQFGGYCAYAVTAGFTASPESKAYIIKNDKLYMFSAEDVKINFVMNTEKSIQTAETKWNE